MINEADRRFMDAVKYSIAQFGLADHEEKEQGVLPKIANEFLFEKRCSLASVKTKN